MEFRQLGGSGFKVPVLSLGTGTFGGGNEFFKAWGATRRRGGHATGRHLPGRWPDDVRLGRHLLDRHGRRDPGSGDQRAARPGDHLHQGNLPLRSRTERRGVVALRT